MKLFEDKLLLDDRESSFSWDAFGYHFDVLFPKKEFFDQVFVILMLQVFTSVLLSAIVYYGILQRKNESSSILVAFGIVIPLALSIPFWILDFLDIRAVVVRKGLIIMPCGMLLKCLEATFGFCPPHATRSLTRYIRHAGFFLYPIYKEDGTVVRSTLASVWRSIHNQNKCWLVGLVLFQILAPCEFCPFPVSRDPTELFVATELGQWLNSYIWAVLLSLALRTSFFGAGAVNGILSGIQLKDEIDRFPMFCSTSPSDFWGERWNQMIHHALKQGVYKPVRSKFQRRWLAIAATFVASGLMHEYVWALLFYVTKQQIAEADRLENPTVVFQHGKQVLFFGWNGLLLILEFWIGKHFAVLKKYLPRPILGALVVACALPVAHLYMGDLVALGYFRQMQVAFPLLRVRPQY